MSAGCLLRPFLSFSTSLSPVSSAKEGRSEGERASRLSSSERRLAPRERGRRNFASASEPACRASRAEKARERKERRARWTRGCRRLHGNEARRECDGNHGSRGFLSRADLSVPLSGLSSSSFSSSGPLPSAHGASKRPRGRRSSRADL